MTDVVIVGAARTPVGAFNGALSSVPASYLGQVAIAEALKRAKVDAKEVTEVILGQILTAGAGQNPARQAAINAGIPAEKTAYAINQLCGSGLRAVALGYQAIKVGDSEIVVELRLPPPQSRFRSKSSGRAVETTRTATPVDQSTRWSRNSSRAGSAQCRSSTTRTSGNRRTAARFSPS